MSENTTEITDEAIAGFIENGTDTPGFHPILEVWREVLAPIAVQKDEPVTAQWANKIIGSYHGVGFADMNDVRDRYFSKLKDIADILDHEISTDPECLNVFTAPDDVEHNTVHYKNLLILWQQLFMSWELSWDCTDPGAAAEIVAMSEVHKMIFGELGILPFLEQIQFVFDDDDKADLAEALESMKVGK